MLVAPVAAAGTSAAAPSGWHAPSPLEFGLRDLVSREASRQEGEGEETRRTITKLILLEHLVLGRIEMLQSVSVRTSSTRRHAAHQLIWINLTTRP